MKSLLSLFRVAAIDSLGTRASNEWHEMEWKEVKQEGAFEDSPLHVDALYVLLTFIL
jgi:hypothetical protein